MAIWRLPPRPQQPPTKTPIITVAPGGWANIAKVNGVSAAAISKINSVAVAAIAKIKGTAV